MGLTSQTRFLADFSRWIAGGSQLRNADHDLLFKTINYACLRRLQLWQQASCGRFQLLSNDSL